MRRWTVLVLAVAAALLVADLPLFPIYPWDEARLAVNAMEMRQSGLSLVTTYGFQPDLWNTKPPLMIWLMDASMALFGPHEWALRLPSALATLGSMAIVMALCWRMTRSTFVTVAAAVLLLASRGFTGLHVAQTADYDALMCFFTTAYGATLFLALSRRRPRPGLVLLSGLLIAGAVLTKGIAGLTAGVGMAAYVLWTRRWARPLRSPWCWLAGAIAVIPPVAFYLAREAAAPGYLEAVWSNEIGGRYFGVVHGHDRWFGYYLVQAFVVAGFSLGVLSPFLFWPVRWLTGRRRALARYALIAAAAILLALSLSATKIRWYIAPAYPFLAIAGALGLEALYVRAGAEAARLTGALGWAARHRRVLLIFWAVVILAEFPADRYVYLRPGEHKPSGRYGQVFARLYAQGVRRVAILDSGIENSEGFIGYAPQADFYALVWREKRFDAERLPLGASLSLGSGEVVATCNGADLGRLLAAGRDLAGVPDCAAVRL